MAMRVAQCGRHVCKRACLCVASGKGEVACLRSLLTCGNNTSIESNAPHSSDYPPCLTLPRSATLQTQLRNENSYFTSLACLSFLLYLFYPLSFPSFPSTYLLPCLPFILRLTFFLSLVPSLHFPFPLSFNPPLSVFPSLTRPPPHHPSQLHVFHLFELPSEE